MAAVWRHDGPRGTGCEGAADPSPRQPQAHNEARSLWHDPGALARMHHPYSRERAVSWAECVLKEFLVCCQEASLSLGVARVPPAICFPGAVAASVWV